MGPAKNIEQRIAIARDQPLPARGSAASLQSRSFMDPDCRMWNLACLRGSAEGYARGTVTLPRVRTWVQRALRVGASAEEVGRGVVDVDGDRTKVEVLGSGVLPERLVVDVVTEALPDAALSCGDRAKSHVAQRASVRS